MLPTYSSRNERSLLLFTRKSFPKSSEKFLIVLVLLTFCFVCFCGLFYLPDFGSKTRALDVYQQFKQAAPDMFIPAPPIDKPHHQAHHHRGDDGPNNGVDTEGHVIDRAKLEAKIREELGDLNLDRPETEKMDRQEEGRMVVEGNSQHVKPEENIVLAPPNQIEENKNVGQAPGGAVGGSGTGDNHHPVPIPHADNSDKSVTEKRDKVREVSFAGWL